MYHTVRHQDQSINLETGIYDRLVSAFKELRPTFTACVTYMLRVYV